MFISTKGEEGRIEKKKKREEDVTCVRAPSCCECEGALSSFSPPLALGPALVLRLGMSTLAFS